MKPISSHSRKVVFPGSSGLMWIPRKMSGRAIRTTDKSIVAISVASVVFESAIHL